MRLTHERDDFLALASSPVSRHLTHEDLAIRHRNAEKLSKTSTQHPKVRQHAPRSSGSHAGRTDALELSAAAVFRNSAQEARA